KVESLASRQVGFERESDAAGEVAEVATAREPLAGADRDSAPARPHAPQDVLLATLVVALAVHRRQPQGGGAARQVHVFDVELVVVIPVRDQAAIRVPL